jgi:hypothetical protein
VPGQQNIAEYYTPQGLDWQRWSDAISFFPPASLPRSTWVTYYRDQLNGGNFGVVTLFYSTTFRAVSMPAGILLPHHSDQVYQELLGLVGQNSAEPGLPALTQALETDPAYRLVSTGPFDTSNLSGTHDYSIYAIWQKKAPE